MHSSHFSIVTLLAASCHGFNAFLQTDDVTDLGNGVTKENNATHAHNIVEKLYADVAIPSPAATSFNLQTGGVTLAGYYSLLGGSSQIDAAIDACKGLNGVADGLKCANAGLAALTANSLAFLAGAAYGQGTIGYIAGVAREATGLPSPNARLRKRACPTLSPIITNSYWPGGNAGVKLTAENVCTHITSDQVAAITDLSMEMISLMKANNAWQTQATYYYTNTQGDNISL